MQALRVCLTYGHPAQGVYVPAGELPLPPLESSEHTMTDSRYNPMWARGRALLVAAEKVAQVVTLVSAGKRKALQEGAPPPRVCHVGSTCVRKC